jgi:DNA polymerase III subunit epsilon
MTGLAVLDVETTGFNFAGTDRVIELGIVLLDSNMEPESTFTWLINPRRDVGPTHIHGVKPAWLKEAPEFFEVAPSIASVLQGRAIIGHNVSFDRNFLVAEFSRAGQDIAIDEMGWFCTKKLAQWTWPALGKYSLAALCESLGIVNANAHSALEDALATAELFRRMTAENDQLVELVNNQSSEVQHWPSFDSVEVLPNVNRPFISQRLSRTLVQRIVSDLPNNGFSPLESDYLLVLDKAFEDKVLTEDEIDGLISVAQTLGLGVEEVAILHNRYFQTITQRVWEDGVLTESERDELTFIGETLGISAIAVEQAITSRSSESNTSLFQTGDEVCLTGDMIPSKQETASLLEQHGFAVQSGVTKRTKAVVAADPDSMSGKAEKARQYGIPIYSVEQVWQIYKGSE